MKIDGFKPGVFWALSNQILELASNGFPRARFLNDVTQLILETLGCDIIELAVWEGGRQFFGQARREKGRDSFIRRVPI